MKTPLFLRRPAAQGHPERGITMALVALAMVAIIAMAALSIDVITLYLAKEEAQRSADTAALAAAKVLSLSGITGDPSNGANNWGLICGPDDGTNGLATRVAKAVANQNLVGGSPTTTPTVTYSSGGSSKADCTALSTTGFGVNPIVTVQLSRPSLPTFFSRIWGNRGNSVSATATAEVFNPSNSGAVGNNPTGTLIPVQPRCVKPWVVPNQNPFIPQPNSSGQYCNQGAGPCNKIVSNTDGSIQSQGMTLNGGGASGLIGATFWMVADCQHNDHSQCTIRRANGPAANYGSAGPDESIPNLLYVPGQVTTTPIAVPSCTSGDDFEKAIEGCDQPTNYTCGVPPSSGGSNAIDLSRNPEDATSEGVACLTHQASNSDVSEPTGQDYLNQFMLPSAYPFQILAGSSNPLVAAGLPSGSPVTVSPSIVSLPIFDETGVTVSSGTATSVTFVGFLQVFINAVDNFGNINVTVLNVAGCGNGTNPVGSQVIANSPVPVRLITPP
jgi:type II secretory pathway pseudopilin PulG